jgi:hypothetical protein
LGPGAGGGGGDALNGARVTPVSGFFVGDGGWGTTNRGCAPPVGDWLGLRTGAELAAAVLAGEALGHSTRRAAR